MLIGYVDRCCDSDISMNKTGTITLDKPAVIEVLAIDMGDLDHVMSSSS